MHPHDEKTTMLASIVQRQTHSLSRLLDDLLDVARITQGRVQLHMELMPLQSCVDMALESVGHSIGERHHDLVIERADEPLYARADRVRLAQCLSNLLANAARYTDPGGLIRLRTYADGSDAVIEVSDNGQGIAAEFVPQMFDLFAQGERALDRAQGGLGVGLCVCRELMQMQEGSVSGTSPGLGQGATFWLRLPLALAPSASARAVTVYRTTRRILVVDDNQDAADALAVLLQMEGHEVQAVYEAEVGLARLASFVPDIALLDIGLPHMDGYELASRMRQRNIPGLKLVAVSGYGRPEDRARSKAAGFDAHLLKPVDIGDLRAVLSSGGKFQN
jgi:CheY-like chemotaxis protein